MCAATQEMVEVIHTSGDHLLNVVNDILDASELSLGLSALVVAGVFMSLVLFSGSAAFASSFIHI